MMAVLFVDYAGSDGVYIVLIASVPAAAATAIDDDGIVLDGASGGDGDDDHLLIHNFCTLCLQGNRTPRTDPLSRGTLVCRNQTFVHMEIEGVWFAIMFLTEQGRHDLDACHYCVR